METSVYTSVARDPRDSHLPLSLSDSPVDRTQRVVDNRVEWAATRERGHKSIRGKPRE